MPTYEDVWPRDYIAPEDIDGPKRLVIDRVELREFYNKFTQSHEEKPVVWFKTTEGRRVGRFLILGKTTWKQIEAIAGAEDSDRWPGTEVVLYRAQRPALQLRQPKSGGNNQ